MLIILDIILKNQLLWKCFMIHPIIMYFLTPTPVNKWLAIFSYLFLLLRSEPLDYRQKFR